MVKYKCWTCGTDIESPESKVGQRETCSHCGTPNLIPKLSEVELSNKPNICYFCAQGFTHPRFTESVHVGLMIEHPYYCCRECGSEWEEPRGFKPSKPSEQPTQYVPRCSSCLSTNVVPCRLPSMPIGQHYVAFKSLGLHEFTMGLKLYLRGTVKVPLCTKCKILRTMISTLPWGVGGTTAFMAYVVVFFKLDIPMNLPGIFFALLLTVPTVITAHLVAWVTRLFLRFTIGRGTDMSKDPHDFHVVQDLRKEGWE